MKASGNVVIVRLLGLLFYALLHFLRLLLDAAFHSFGFFKYGALLFKQFGFGTAIGAASSQYQAC